MGRYFLDETPPALTCTCSSISPSSPRTDYLAHTLSIATAALINAKIANPHSASIPTILATNCLHHLLLAEESSTTLCPIHALKRVRLELDRLVFTIRRSAACLEDICDRDREGKWIRLDDQVSETVCRLRTMSGYLAAVMAIVESRVGESDWWNAEAKGMWEARLEEVVHILMALSNMKTSEMLVAGEGMKRGPKEEEVVMTMLNNQATDVDSSEEQL